MKKLLTFSLALFLLSSTLSISAQGIKKGDKLINLGIGLLDFGGYASAEFAIQDNIGVGPIIGYSYYTGGLLYGGVNNFDYGRFRFGARGAYHLGEVLKMSDDKFDPYIALSVGIVSDRNASSYNFSTNSYEYSNRLLPFFNPRVGARLALSNSLGGYAELGWGGSWIQAGISFKL